MYNLPSPFGPPPRGHSPPPWPSVLDQPWTTSWLKDRPTPASAAGSSWPKHSPPKHWHATASPNCSSMAAPKEPPWSSTSLPTRFIPIAPSPTAWQPRFRRRRHRCRPHRPGHGQEDHQVFQQYGLLNRYSAAELNPVDARGVYLSTTPPLGELTLAGLHIWKANPLIVDALRLRGVLLAAAEMHHSYPHCWRHKTPIVFRATPSGSSLWNKRPCAQPPSRPSHTSPGIPSGAKPASSA